MLYTKIRMDFKYAEKGRFYRVVLIKGNPDLLKLGIALGSSAGCEFEHYFIFAIEKKKICYVPAAMMDDDFGGTRALIKHNMDELPDEFEFVYDLGDDWAFECKRYKKKVEFDSDKDIVVIEGAGQGIWEDNIGTLYDYLDGKIDKDCDKEDGKKGIYKPWNVDIDKFSDFDLPLDLDKTNEFVNTLYPADCAVILQNENDFIKQNKIDLKDRPVKNPAKDMAMKAQDHFLEGVDKDIDAQLKGVPFVKKAYNDLKKIFEPGIARSVIQMVYLKVFMISFSTVTKFESSRYEKELKDTVQYLKTVEKGSFF